MLTDITYKIQWQENENTNHRLGENSSKNISGKIPKYMWAI